MEGLTVGGLAERYSEFAAGYYVKHGRPTTEVDHVRSALKAVLSVYGEDLVSSFGPLKLKAVRKQVNKRVDRIRRMFAWGVEEELVPPMALVALRAVRGLCAGRTAARESVKVRPVSDEHVDAIRPFVGRQVWAMVELQRWSGMRPGEVCVIRTGDVAVKDGVWEFRPVEHKMEHAERERVVYLGPRAQEVIRPWLRLVLEEYLFSPREAASDRARSLREGRKTRVQPSQVDRRKECPVRVPAERYSRASYGRAIGRACLRAGVPHWAPNQLRHSVGTRVRSAMGLEASQVVLGHSKADVTQIYAERDADLARRAMERLG